MFRRSARLLLPCAALFLASAFAQTSTDCNPLNTTCPDDAALGTTFHDQYYNKSVAEFNPHFWNITAGSSLISFDKTNGAALTLTTAKDTVTVKSNFYIFWGSVEVLFRAAPGQGIISTVILLSDDLDEIDWEIMGGNTTNVENNYYGWGNTSQINSIYPALDGAQSDFHNYTVDWTQERIQYLLNGNVVREVPYAVPGQYPQTPCRIQFGVWCGGCSDAPGTVQWAGGKPDWSKGPFTMNIQSIRITDGTTNSSTYTYGDQSGLYSSIQVTEGESVASKAINKLSAKQQAEKKWNGLSTGAKIGIAAGVLGTFAIAFIAFLFYCFKERKAGRLEAAAQEKAWEEQNAELMEYRSMMAKGNFAVSRESVMMDMKAARLGQGVRGSKRF